MTFKLDPDHNPIRIAAVLFLLIGFLFFYLHFTYAWSIPTTFNLVGIICNVVGALWIASGVYLFGQDRDHLGYGKPSRSKYAKKLATLLVSASKVIPLGILYVIVGGSFQAIAIVGVELKWFLG